MGYLCTRCADGVLGVDGVDVYGVPYGEGDKRLSTGRGKK